MLFSQRFVRLYLVPFFVFILARSPETRPLTQRLPYQPTSENETHALSEPAFADRFVSGGPVPAELHDEAAEKSREFAVSK